MNACDNLSRSIRLLEASGYTCSRADKNLQPWDVFGIGPTDMVLVRIVTGYWPNPEALTPLCEFPSPPNCKKLVHQWRDGAELPTVHLVPKSNLYLAV
jgi:hypothetical protein